MEMNEYREDIYRTYHPRVLSYVRSKVGRAFDAEDLTSEIFLKVFRALDQFNAEKASLSTWIYAIARNYITDCFRARKLESVSYDDALENDAAIETAESDDEDELLEKLDRALDTLPARQREIIILHYYFNLPHKDIAQRMNLSYTNTRQLCYVAVGALKKRMAAQN